MFCGSSPLIHKVIAKWSSREVKGWDPETGIWRKSSKMWDVNLDIPDSAPEDWFSKPGGDYYIGMSFHISPFTIVEGEGTLDSHTHFKPSNFYLARTNDPYNSWGVNAVAKGFVKFGCMDHWNWLPGITIFDDSKKFTLPSEDLSAFSGTEWADNDHRIFHGIYSDEIRDSLITKYIEDINKITGPKFSGWPFGRRQLKDAVFVWIHYETHKIDAVLLASTVQSGDKFSYFNSKLYNPGTKLGSWNNKPATWDCRQVIKFLYKSRLLLQDGFHEIALVTASSAVETAFFEIVLYLEHNDSDTAKIKIKEHSFRDRAKILIHSYGYTLPASIFNGMTDAYKARNSIAHELNSYSHDMATLHINNLEMVIEWYYKNI